MATIVFLEDGNPVPNTGDRIEVKFVRNGAAVQFDATIWTGDKVIYDPGRAPWRQAREHAFKNAATYRIPIIYALGVPHDHRT